MKGLVFPICLRKIPQHAWMHDLDANRCLDFPWITNCFGLRIQTLQCTVTQEEDERWNFNNAVKNETRARSH